MHGSDGLNEVSLRVVRRIDFNPFLRILLFCSNECIEMTRIDLACSVSKDRCFISLFFKRTIPFIFKGDLFGNIAFAESPFLARSRRFHSAVPLAFLLPGSLACFLFRRLTERIFKDEQMPIYDLRYRKIRFATDESARFKQHCIA
jgi:hypothetical protein